MIGAARSLLQIEGGCEEALSPCGNEETPA